MIRYRVVLLWAVATGWAMPAGAGEIDSFTQRYSLHTDATALLDAKTNALLAQAVDAANGGPDAEERALFSGDRAPACSEFALYDNVRELLARRFVGQLQIYVLHNPAIEKSVLTRKTSIYRDFGLLETPTLGIGQRGSPVIRMGGFVIGSDKLGHFFAEGYDYFKRVYLHDAAIDRALRYGEFTERLFFGGTMTGVYSYADLVANFNGMRFWAHLTGRYPDILGGGSAPKPYVECRDNHWVKTGHFSWANYVDAAWDEGINCSLFRNDSLAQRVKTRLRELERKTGHRMTCPVRRDVAHSLKMKYKRFFARLVNLEGHGSFDNRLFVSKSIGHSP
jgi:hypothetical protein